MTRKTTNPLGDIASKSEDVLLPLEEAERQNRRTEPTDIQNGSKDEIDHKNLDQ